jgi:hypothetical protein
VELNPDVIPEAYPIPDPSIPDPPISGPSVIRIIAGILSAFLIIGTTLITVPARPSKSSATGTRLLHTPYLLSIAAGFLAQLGGLWLMNHIPSFMSAEEVGLIIGFEDNHQLYFDRVSESLTYAAMLDIPYFAGAVGSVIASLFADKYGVVRIYVVCELIAGACLEFDLIVQHLSPD